MTGIPNSINAGSLVYICRNAPGKSTVRPTGTYIMAKHIKAVL
jgi:hypothetical protein